MYTFLVYNWYKCILSLNRYGIDVYFLFIDMEYPFTARTRAVLVVKSASYRPIPQALLVEDASLFWYFDYNLYSDFKTSELKVVLKVYAPLSPDDCTCIDLELVKKWKKIVFSDV